MYDEKHACPEAFVVGALVLKRDARRKKRAGGKLDTKYSGPYTITKCLSKGIYSLQKVGDHDPANVVKRVNGADLRPYNKATDHDKTLEVTSESASDDDRVSVRHTKYSCRPGGFGTLVCIHTQHPILNCTAQLHVSLLSSICIMHIQLYMYMYS